MSMVRMACKAVVDIAGKRHELRAATDSCERVHPAL